MLCFYFQGAVSVNSDQSRKCKLRYERRVYLSVVKQHPVVLLSVPGSMSVTVRLLVEHSTSVLSGSMETNRSGALFFPDFSLLLSLVLLLLM